MTTIISTTVWVGDFGRVLLAFPIPHDLNVPPGQSIAVLPSHDKSEFIADSIEQVTKSPTREVCTSVALGLIHDDFSQGFLVVNRVSILWHKGVFFRVIWTEDIHIDDDKRWFLLENEVMSPDLVWRPIIVLSQQFGLDVEIFATGTIDVENDADIDYEGDFDITEPPEIIRNWNYDDDWLFAGGSVAYAIESIYEKLHRL